MKKLLAITVIFALVAGAAFAETTVGGSIEVRYRVDGSDEKDSKVTNTGRIDNAAVSLTGADDDGTFGGTLKLVYTNEWQVTGANKADGAAGAGDPVIGVSRTYATLAVFDRAFIWWQPIEQIKFWMGKDGDGLFNSAGVSRWGFHQMDRGLAFEHWGADGYLMGNWSGPGIAMMVYPVDGLEINLALGTDWQEEVGKSFTNRFQAQVGYNLDGVGKFTLTLQPRGVSAKESKVGLTYTSAEFVEGLSFELGFAFDATEKKKDNMKIGLGAEYKAGDFGVKLRAFIDPNIGAKNDELGWDADIMPYYSLGDIGTIYCAIGINGNTRAGRSMADDIGFYFNPYLRKDVSNGQLRFGGYYENRNGDKVSTWRIGTTWLINF